MKVVIDIEANALNNPTKIWCIVCKRIDVEGDNVTIFRGLTDDKAERERFRQYAEWVQQWVGHNLLDYDVPVVSKLLDINIDVGNCIDTYLLSKLVNYSRPGGHSIEQYGQEFGLAKGNRSLPDFFSKWSQSLEDYCVRDVEICHKIYSSLRGVVHDPSWRDAIWLEQRFQLIVSELHSRGYGFDLRGCGQLLNKVTLELGELDEDILKAFPPKEVLVREFTPKLTKFGTISRTSVPRSLHSNIHEYESGKTYRHTRLETFNPSSHKQLISVLNAAGWRPEDKTTTHIEAERIQDKAKLEKLKVSGWKINEQNLSTLPSTAPVEARLLAKRILLESRRRTLSEWSALVQVDGRIHGKFYGIGAWTHRMAHQKPNTANIPTAVTLDGSVKLLGKEMRSLWIAPEGKVLVGVDAEGIQLRIFAHYIEDQEFTDALVNGKKSDKTDPHSLNQRILGSVCKSREAAKRFIYALLLGAGNQKLSKILGASDSETKQALNRLLKRYTGFAKLKNDVIPADASRGFFIGLDGRHVPIPGDTLSERKHLCMSGYLQNGEAIVIKRAGIIIDDLLQTEKELNKWLFVDIVHDEYVMEVDPDIAQRVKKVSCDAIRQAGEIYKLKCPLAGSGDIGLTWSDIH